MIEIKKFKSKGLEQPQYQYYKNSNTITEKSKLKKIV